MEEKICKKQKNVEKRIKMIYNRFGTKKEKICEIKINRLLNNIAIYRTRISYSINLSTCIAVEKELL